MHLGFVLVIVSVIGPLLVDWLNGGNTPTGTTFAFYRRLKGANSANVVNGVFLFCLKL